MATLWPYSLSTRDTEVRETVNSRPAWASSGRLSLKQNEKRKRNNSKEKVFNYRTLSGWLVNDRRRREVCIKPYVSEFCKATCLYIHKLVWDHSIELVLLQPMKETGSQIMHLGELSLHRLSLSRPDSCTLCPKGLYLHCLSRHSTLLLPKCPP